MHLYGFPSSDEVLPEDSEEENWMALLALFFFFLLRLLSMESSDELET